MKTILSFAVVASLAAGCVGSAQQHATSPTARADALKMFIAGKSCGEVAQTLGIDRDEARDLIRTGIVDLDRRYYRSR